MTAWLDPIARVLDRRPYPVAIFVRDDDAGWDDARQLALLDVFADEHFPIDLAVIPTAIGAALAEQLLNRASSQPLGIHQHGFAHLNHEALGRRCEFGSARPLERQYADIRQGRQVLLDRCGSRVDPIFTPPWNRCTDATGLCLRDLGIKALSRDATAGTLGLDSLVECPIRIDWFARRRGVRLSRPDWAGQFASAIERSSGPFGVMLHHAVMDSEERGAWSRVLHVIARHPNVRGMLMRDAIAMAPAGRLS